MPKTIQDKGLVSLVLYKRKIVTGQLLGNPNQREKRFKSNLRL